MGEAVSWIAADWGTSNLRLWALDGRNDVLAERGAPCGMGSLQPEAFEPALIALIDDLLPPDGVTRVLVCGMAGARQGWVEAPYFKVPCRPVGTHAQPAPTRDARLRVRILPGLAQDAPADVMRGEETQIAGYLARNPGFQGTICLPGTHTKWVRIRNGQVDGFRTVMTGEIFALLGTQSVLRHSAGTGWDADAFDDGVAAGLSHPEALLADLFSVRAAALLSDPAEGAGRARMSGLLIGAELAAMRRFWDAADVVLVGAPEVSALYATALGWLGARPRVMDTARLTLTGLIAAYEQLDWGQT
ncbi:2-dehydro-3-deoxygalactonokinase [Seohaeicola saemankumensis]|nr:2-dehydro-3-deoxygalactonokinase [Seohaeicola saemankumensis]MCA0870681.1 2-dehydro-3-deoxygalactonokinase [Seohaeicola saemankumensis]